MFKTRRKMSGQETPKKGVLPLLFHPQFNTSLWFMKIRNDAPSVMNKSVRNIGVRSLVDKTGFFYESLSLLVFLLSIEVRPF